AFENPPDRLRSANEDRRMQVEAVAKEVIASLSSGVQIPPFSSRPGGLTLAQAYRVTALLRAAFEARGETITGGKIAVPIRHMWTAFGVESPIWGYTTSRTTRELAVTPLLSLKNFSEPRIEPEIMFGLSAPPAPDMNDSAMIDCLEWVALGYE